MKRLSLVIISLFVSSVMLAQQVSDVTESNCDNSSSETLYDYLNQGKVVLIAADGFDCSICQSHAPSLGSFASANPNIKVWGAMHYKYSSSQPTCNNINSWRNSYSWNDIFMFVDEDRSWAGSGYPTYTVIDPSTKEIAYRGSSHTAAQNKAKELNSSTGIGNVNAEALGLSANYHNSQLKVISPESSATLEIYNLAGNLISSATLSQGENNLNLSVEAGVYLMRYSRGNVLSTLKILVR